MKKYYLITGLVFALALGNFAFAQTDTDETTVDETVVDDSTTTDPTDDTETTAAEEVEAEEADNQDEDITEDQDEPELINEDVEVTDEEITGEVIEVTDETITILTADGETVEISRGGGTLLSPFVRSANLNGIKVGDNVTATVATEVSIMGEVAGVDATGALNVKTVDGQTRTIQPGVKNVVIKKDGKVVDDFTTLATGDEIEVVYEGTLVSDVDKTEVNSSAGWVIPVAIILIVLILAGLLAKRNRD